MSLLTDGALLSNCVSLGSLLCLLFKVNGCWVCILIGIGSIGFFLFAVEDDGSVSESELSPDELDELDDELDELDEPSSSELLESELESDRLFMFSFSFFALFAVVGVVVDVVDVAVPIALLSC